MFKAQTSIENTTEFLQKLQAAKIDQPANDSLIRKEFQVFVYSCKNIFSNTWVSYLEKETQMEVNSVKICINQLLENGNNALGMKWLG